MASSDAEIFRASLSRCMADTEFLHDFYEHFMASSDEVREKFKATDFPRQTRVLADSLYLMAVAADSEEGAMAWKVLGRLGERHSRNGLDIRPDLYESWLACLIEAASRFDPEFSPNTEQSWRRALAPGIEYLRSRYEP